MSSVGPPLGPGHPSSTTPPSPVSPPAPLPSVELRPGPTRDRSRSGLMQDSPPSGASDSRRGGVDSSLDARIIEAIRPMLHTQSHCRPVRLRASLTRLQEAIAELDVLDDDPLMKTAYTLLTEEQLRVEMLRQRLQMVLEG